MITPRCGPLSAAVLAVSLALPVTVLAADRVVLKDGRRIEGALRVAGDHLVVSRPLGSIRLPRAEIARVEIGIAAEPTPPRRIVSEPRPARKAEKRVETAKPAVPGPIRTVARRPRNDGAHAHANQAAELRARIIALEAAAYARARTPTSSPTTRPSTRNGTRARRRLVLGIQPRGRTVGRVRYRTNPYYHHGHRYDRRGHRDRSRGHRR